MSTSVKPITLKTQCGSVECAVSGEGPAIVALHGAMGGYDQSLLLARTVGPEGFRYIAVSRPGYLGTPLTVGRTPAEQADACASLLDALDIQKAGVMAVSGGGLCAIQFALRHPERCSNLLLFSAGCGRMESPIPWTFHLLKIYSRIPLLVSAMGRKLEKNPDRAASRSIPDPELRARTLNDPETGPLFRELLQSTTYKMALRLPGTWNDISQYRIAPTYPVEQIAVPTLVVHGTADNIAPFALARSLSERIPGAKLLPVERGEHVAIFTHRQDVRTCVSKFLCQSPIPVS